MIQSALLAAAVLRFGAAGQCFAGGTAPRAAGIVTASEQHRIVATAVGFLAHAPATTTAHICRRSAGGPHDFYSDSDYWWPDPQHPAGPFIKRDGETNPDNFVAHRQAMIRFSEIVGRQTSAWLLTGDTRFVQSVQRHLEAWMIEPATRMNPHLRYAAAIQGRATGRSFGIIDAIHLVEVARSVEILEQRRALPPEVIGGAKRWFRALLTWLTTDPFGVEEMNAKNNHGTCWVLQVGAFARLVGDEELLALCRQRFKDVLLPGQMAADGSFPLELARTKPYGYSLFNLDAFFAAAEILSDEKTNLREYVTADGRCLRRGAEFLYPFVKTKAAWPHARDVMHWDDWPVRHPFLRFAGQAYGRREYLELWQTLDGYPTTAEVIRNLPIRHPLLWQDLSSAR